MLCIVIALFSGDFQGPDCPGDLSQVHRHKFLHSFFQLVCLWVGGTGRDSGNWLGEKGYWNED